MLLDGLERVKYSFKKIAFPLSMNLTLLKFLTVEMGISDWQTV